jgi:hypothetical protein
MMKNLFVLDSVSLMPSKADDRASGRGHEKPFLNWIDIGQHGEDHRRGDLCSAATDLE